MKANGFAAHIVHSLSNEL